MAKHSIGVILLLACASLVAAQAPQSATAPASLKDGWEQIDQRMVFLTVELSSIETSLAAVDKAIRAGSHNQAVKQGQADTYRKGNELMDRNAGGPVSWDKFYGKTAEKFFYHPAAGAIYVNPKPVAQRPPQLDYIYRANSQAASRAQADIAALGDQLQLLQSRRRQLEAQQEALWCKISFEALASREFAEKPLYRFAPSLTTSIPLAVQQLDSLAAAARFIVTADALAAYVSKRPDSNSDDSFPRLAQTISSERRTFNDRLIRNPLLAADLADPNTAIGHIAAIAKRLDEFSQNIADAHRAAVDADQADDGQRKDAMRGQVQQSLIGYAESVLQLDRAATDLNSTLHATPDLARELPAPSFDWPVAPTPTTATGAAPSPASLSSPASLNATAVSVEATRSSTNPVATGIHLARGQTFTLLPNPADSWAKGSGSRKGKQCDFQGYPGTNSSTGLTAGANWMAMKWRIGAADGPVTSGSAISAPEAGELFLYCNDDKPSSNHGVIRVNIKLSSASTFIAP